MQQDREDWPVSTTGGKKITGSEAASMLHVSYTYMYTLVDQGELLRAEPRKKMFKKQPFVFYLTDVVNLAVKYGIMTPDEANERLRPNLAAASSVAA